MRSLLKAPAFFGQAKRPLSPVRPTEARRLRDTGDFQPAPLVLVLDDHDDSRVIARLVLETAGFRVLEARAGLEGLRLAITRSPNVILLDMILPEIDGWEIARLLRADPDTRYTSIVAVTALASQDEQDRALLAGCDEVLTKPVPPTVLLRTVQRYVAVPLAPGARKA